MTEDLGSWEIRDDYNNLKTLWNYNLVPILPLKTKILLL